MTVRTPRQKAHDDLTRKTYATKKLPKTDVQCPFPPTSGDAKAWYREQIDVLTQKFLANGGEITVLPDYDAFNDSDYNPAHPHAYEGER